MVNATVDVDGWLLMFIWVVVGVSVKNGFLCTTGEVSVWLIRRKVSNSQSLSVSVPGSLSEENPVGGDRYVPDVVNLFFCYV